MREKNEGNSSLMVNLLTASNNQLRRSLADSDAKYCRIGRLVKKLKDAHKEGHSESLEQLLEELEKETVMDSADE